jgi:hypothetical protein
MVRLLLLILCVLGTMVAVGSTANAETVERVRCNNQGCRTVTIHRKPGCRRISLGGWSRGTAYKTVCGQG